MVVTTLRLLTYNVYSLRRGRADVAEVVRRTRPDVAVIQEAPRRLRWRSKCAALARESGLLYLGGGRSAGGNLILVGTRVRASTRAVVARRTPTPRRAGTIANPIRGVVGAVIVAGEQRLGVVGLHLGLSAEERERQVPQVLGVAGELGTEATLLAGDLNEDAGDRSWKVFADAGYRDLAAGGAPTFRSDDPTTRIDGILGSEGIEVLDCDVPRLDPARLTGASDHLPVLAELRLRPRP